MKAYQLLERPESWTKGHSARNSRGEWVSVHEESAVCWCMEGALSKCYGDDSYWKRLQVEKHLGISFPLHMWNDDPARTHSEVLAALKGAGI